MILEIATYMKSDRVSLDDFYAIIPDMDKFLSSRAGFIRRQVYTDEEHNNFTDLVWWESLDHALNAARAVAISQELGKFFATLKSGSSHLQHIELLHDFP